MMRIPAGQIFVAIAVFLTSCSPAGFSRSRMKPLLPGAIRQVRDGSRPFLAEVQFRQANAFYSIGLEMEEGWQAGTLRMVRYSNADDVAAGRSRADISAACSINPQNSSPYRKVAHELLDALVESDVDRVDGLVVGGAWPQSANGLGISLFLYAGGYKQLFVPYASKLKEIRVSTPTFKMERWQEVLEPVEAELARALAISIDKQELIVPHYTAPPEKPC